MASFTDSLQPFTPYVEQFPVQAALQVGLQKQAQYNQGVQKIQTQIDSVAGMDVIRDVDKQYLQSKLNQLGGDLKHMAAGDFSSFQLQNSVGGMVSKIGKDPIIQNAVLSTQYVRKGQQEIETARQEGKSAPENEAWWNNQVNSWLTNPDTKASFKGRYIPYRDVDAKLRKMAEKINEIDNSIDIPYRRDAAGNVLTDKNGNPLVDDAMLRIKTKGKPAEKILSNFYTSLDEADKQQLMITGNYHYRNADKETLKSDVFNVYNENKKTLSDSLVTLNLELQTSSKLTPSQKGEIEAKINDINLKLTSGSLETDLQKQLANIDSLSDLTDYKYKLYTQKYLSNLAKDLAYQSYQQEFVSNPYAQMGMEKARLQFQYDNANRQQKNWEADHNWDRAKFFAEQQQKTGAGKPATPGRLPTETAPPTLDTLSKEITSILGDKKTGEMGQIDVLNSEYAPLITDSTLSTPDQKKAYLDKLAIEYSKDPSSIDSLKDPNVREYLELRRALEIQAAQKQALYNATVDASQPFDKQLNSVLGAEKGITNSQGQELYTAKDIVDIKNTLTRKYMNLSNTSGMSESGSNVDVRGFLNEFKGTRFEYLANIIAKKEVRAPLTSDEKQILKRVEEVIRVGGSKRLDIAEQKAKFQSEYLAKHMPERQTSIFTLDVNNSEAKNRIDEGAVEALLGAKFAQYQDLGGVDNESFSQFDPATVAEFKKNKEAIYTVEKNFDGSANLRISSGGEEQIVPMTSGEFRTFFPNYARVNPIQNIKDAILASPNKTTNISGKKNDAVNAYITGYQLPQLANTSLAPLVRVDVEGSPSNKGDERDRYVIRMYVNDNGTWIPDVITQKGFVNEATLHAALQEIGPKTVADLLKKNKK